MWEDIISLILIEKLAMEKSKGGIFDTAITEYFKVVTALESESWKSFMLIVS